MALTSDKEYIPAYDDPTSAEYKALENEILPQVGYPGPDLIPAWPRNVYPIEPTTIPYNVSNKYNL